MNKLWILLIGGCLALGSYLQLSGILDLSQYITLPTQQINGVITQFKTDPMLFVKNNITIIAGGLTVLGLGYGAINNVINKTKKQAASKIEQAKAETTQLSTDYLKLEQEKQLLETQLQQKTEEYSEFDMVLQQKDETIIMLQNQLKDLEKQKDRLENMVDFFDKKSVLIPKDPLPVH